MKAEMDALQLQGTLTSEQWRDLLRFYHGRKGPFVFAAFEWLNARVWDHRLPTPLFQWALTAYGGCLGFTQPQTQMPPVITLHPAIWDKSHLTRTDRGWAAAIPAGRRFALDVVIHECTHVEVEYLCTAEERSPYHSSHDNPAWCAAIERIAERLRGTMLETREFKAAPTRRIRENRKQLRRTPDGCLSMDEISRWPGSIRDPSYCRSQEVPFDFENWR